MSLTNAQLNELRSLLEDEMSDIRDRLDYNDSYQLQTSFQDSIEELSLRDNHPGDIGSEVFERGKDLALRDADSIRLAEIDAALERMEDNVYGVCAHCSVEIPFERLQANPAAQFCVPCREQAENRKIDEAGEDRPAEEEFLYPGFGRTFMDNNEWNQAAYDGEDAWQDVARYGTSATNDENADQSDPDRFWADSEERLGYVEDIEGFVVTDIEGNPMEGPPFVRNAAYYRAFAEADERYWDEK